VLVWAHARVAQLVEHFPEEEGVAGSSPAPSTKWFLFDRDSLYNLPFYDVKNNQTQAMALARLYAKFSLTALVEFGEFDSEEAVLFSRFCFLYLNLLR
jgi:hypothetical protein